MGETERDNSSAAFPFISSSVIDFNSSDSLLLARIRGFLLLTLRDVENGSGVPAYRLSQAERGLSALNVAEQRALAGYYEARWRMVTGQSMTAEEMSLLEK